MGDCNTCYQAVLTHCPETITVKAGLTADTEYKVKFTDKFGNRYTKEVTTNGSGEFTITVDADFPTGLFNSVSGVFEIQVSLTANPWTPVDLTFSTVAYKCIQVSFAKDNSTNTTIQ